MNTRTRYVLRPPFACEVIGEGKSRLLVCAGSEWHLLMMLRGLSRDGKQLAWFESSGRPLTPRSLAALNCYLRTRAIRFWRSKRWDGNRELIGWGEWAGLCRALGLKFDGKSTRIAA